MRTQSKNKKKAWNAGNAGDRGAIGFRFKFDWLRKRREFKGPFTEQSEAKLTKSRITSTHNWKLRYSSDACSWCFQPCSLHTKSHVKHPVSFIKDQICNSFQICALCLHMINQTTLELDDNKVIKLIKRSANVVHEIYLTTWDCSHLRYR